MNNSEDTKTILIVEDDAIIAMAEKMTLEASGYTIVTANTGGQAIEICRTNGEINLILMNIDLGTGMNGPEAATQILKDHELPVVFLSSHTKQEVFSQIKEIASYGYTVKGSSDNVLKNTIEMAFRLFKVNRRLAAENECHGFPLNSNGDTASGAIAAQGIPLSNPRGRNRTVWRQEEALNMSTEDRFAVLDSHSRFRSTMPFSMKDFPALDFEKNERQLSHQFSNTTTANDHKN